MEAHVLVPPSEGPAATPAYSAAGHHDDIMGSDIMVRILTAQVRTIYPHEKRIVEGYVAAGAIPASARVLSIGCGTGEFERRLLEDFKDFDITGIDVDEGHLERAQLKCSAFGPRATFLLGDALNLPAEWENTFDLILNRHMIHIFNPENVERVVRGMARACKPGGVVHILAEDYGMLYFDGTKMDADVFWQNAILFGSRTGGDWRIGRKMLRTCLQLADGSATPLFDAHATSQHYIALSTHEDREGFQAIIETWAEGYAEIVGTNSNITPSESRAYWDDMIECIKTGGLGQWLIPVISAVVTRR